MFSLKNDNEIEAIGQGGKILSNILDKIIVMVAPGVSTADLEHEACRLMAEAGGRPAFKDYPMSDELSFPTALCTSINEELVHGPAIPAKILQEGDIISIDLGMEWPIEKSQRDELGLPTNPHSELGGYYTDMAKTVGVGKISQAAKDLVAITRECLEIGIGQAQPGNRLNDIGKAIQNFAEAKGYGVVRELVGHGVGHEVHEDPSVANYDIGDGNVENLELVPGMVIAIEPMVNIGHWKVKTAKDGFAVISADKSLTAHFEHTIAITKEGNRILTI